MKETTLVHIIADGCVLMMHRITKKHDINHGKWIGVGGKFEAGETPEACMRREVYEETGLSVDRYRYCGIVTFVSDEDETEYMHLFTVTGYHDQAGNAVSGGKSISAGPDHGMDGQGRIGPGIVELKTCREGKLEWLPKEQLTRIPHWAGDRIFLPLILDAEIPFFSMKLVYRKGELIHASLNEHNCLVTERLILRPWMAEDASALFRHAGNPKIGPRAGWLPLADLAQSRAVIRDVLSRPEIYAIALRDTAEAIGSVGLQNFRLADENGTCLTFFDERRSANPLVCTEPGDPFGFPEGMHAEAALGYWLAEPFWHQGIMTEAAEALLAHAKKDLAIPRVWADYYEGNEASAQVMKRLGFHFHHIEENRYIEALGERRTAVVQVLNLGDGISAGV